MRIAKVAGASLAVVLLLSVGLVGCGPQEAPPPIHEKVNLEFYGGVLGTAPYVVSIAVSDLLRERHPWLRGEVVETLGSVDTINSMGKLSPERKSRSFAFNGAHTHLSRAIQGLPPYKRAFTELRVAGGVTSINLFGFGTFDPEIKTPQDFVGKKLATNPVFMAPVALAVSALTDAWGIYDQIEISYHTPTALRDTLVTGLADFIYPANALIARGGTFMAPPHTIDAMATRQLYWIGFTQEDVDKINAANPWKTRLVRLPKGALGGNNPPEDVDLLSFHSNLFCFDIVDPEVVYELVRFIIENEDEMSRRTGNLPFDGQSVAQLPPGISEDVMHPGALRYFKEQGLR